MEKTVGLMLVEVGNLVESMLHRVKRFYDPFDEPALSAFRDQLHQRINKVVDDFMVKARQAEITILDSDEEDELKVEINNEILSTSASTGAELNDEIAVVNTELLVDNNFISVVLLGYQTDNDVQDEALDVDIPYNQNERMLDDRNDVTDEITLNTSSVNNEESVTEERTGKILHLDHSNTGAGEHESVSSKEDNVQFNSSIMDYHIEIEIEDEALLHEIPFHNDNVIKDKDGTIESMSIVARQAIEEVSSSNKEISQSKRKKLLNVYGQKLDHIFANTSS